jgi:hypothetical protein
MHRNNSMNSSLFVLALIDVVKPKPALKGRLNSMIHSQNLPRTIVLDGANDWSQVNVQCDNTNPALRARPHVMNPQQCPDPLFSTMPTIIAPVRAHTRSTDRSS